MKKLTTEHWINQAVKTHGDLYNYSLTNYVNRRTKVTIICNRCGSKFEQWPSDHVKGRGCFSCNNTPNWKYNTDIFIAKAKQIFNDKYDYSTTVFTTIANKLELKCNNCNSILEQKASSHLLGHEACYCYTTNASCFSKVKPAIMYYLNIINTNIYKIGITNRSIEERFLPWELSTFTVIKTWSFQTGKEAFEQEQTILKQYSKDKYNGPKLLNSGNSELFNKNILNL